MSRYSLKKALLSENKNSKADILSEGFFTDLMSAIAAGGSVREMIANKLASFGEKAGEMQSNQALEMVKKFRKLGLKTLGGEDLEKMEKALKLRAQKKDKKTVDMDKLSKLLLGDDALEEGTSYRKATLKATFLND